MKILAISGSLRKGSFNTSLLRHAVKTAPKELSIEIADISFIPLYNMDVEDQGFPAPVIALKEKIKHADGILIATPEHNHSVPGVLKNTIDWISRGENELGDKPVAVMGASDGMFGTVRAQIAIQPILKTMNAHLMSQPLMQVTNADKKFDTDGNLIDEKTQQKLKDFIQAFAIWIKRLTDSS